MNLSTWNSFLLPAVVSMVISFIVTGLVAKLGNKLKLVDDPKKHIHPKVTHTMPVPRGGGIPIFVALTIAGWIFLPHNNKTLGIMGACTILTLVGILDDIFEEKVSPYFRLGINILAALCVIGVGIGIAYITNPFGGIIHLDSPQLCFPLLGETRCIWILADIFALLWLVWMQNIVGWSSGVDGQLPGFVVVAAVTLAIWGLRFGNDPAQAAGIILAGLTAGAFAGFLPWNWWPQKIMPGYGGKSLAGFLLGLLAILTVARVGTLLLVLGIPFIDAILVIIKRIREGRSPVWGGREHLHHMLLDRGWSKQRIAILYTGGSILFAIMALQLKAGAKYFTMAGVTLIIIAAIWWLQNWYIYSKQRDLDNGSKT